MSPDPQHPQLFVRPFYTFQKKDQVSWGRFNRALLVQKISSVLSIFLLLSSYFTFPSPVALSPTEKERMRNVFLVFQTRAHIGLIIKTILWIVFSSYKGCIAAYFSNICMYIQNLFSDRLCVWPENSREFFIPNIRPQSKYWASLVLGWSIIIRRLGILAIFIPLQSYEYTHVSMPMGGGVVHMYTC